MPDRIQKRFEFCASEFAGRDSWCRNRACGGALLGASRPCCMRASSLRRALLLPLSVIYRMFLDPDMIEPRTACVPFACMGGATSPIPVALAAALHWNKMSYLVRDYIALALLSVSPATGFTTCSLRNIVYINQRPTTQRSRCCTSWQPAFAVFLESQGDGNLRRMANLTILLVVLDGKSVRVHFAVVRVRGDRKCDHSRLLSEEQRRSAVPLRVTFVKTKVASGDFG